MNGRRSRLAEIGSKIGTDLTILGVLDGDTNAPVYIVLQHQNWCPMACKVFPSYAQAEREAQVLSALSHPNIVPVLGAVPPGHLLMPILDWPTLGECLKTSRGRRLGISDVLRIAIQIGSALNHVHDRGFLHLDVKARNIVMTPAGEPILFNFGSARRIGAPGPAEIFGGSEACKRSQDCRAGEATTATDVFGLGATLYHMLAGRPPYPVAPRRNGNLEDPREEPKPMRPHRRGVSAALENLVFACLEPNPEYRPELCELLPALDDMIRSGPRVLSKGGIKVL